MATSKISLRLITKKDLEFVRCLRNENRRYFFNTGRVTKKMQQVWWQQSWQSGFFIICLGNEPIGTISEKWVNNVQIETRHWVGIHEIGNLMLLKEYQGKGYMTEALRQLTARGGFFVAYVKPKNKASLNVFRRGQFWEVGSE